MSSGSPHRSKSGEPSDHLPSFDLDGHEHYNLGDLGGRYHDDETDFSTKHMPEDLQHGELAQEPEETPLRYFGGFLKPNEGHPAGTPYNYRSVNPSDAGSVFGSASEAKGPERDCVGWSRASTGCVNYLSKGLPPTDPNAKFEFIGSSNKAFNVLTSLCRGCEMFCISRGTCQTCRSSTVTDAQNSIQCEKCSTKTFKVADSPGSEQPCGDNDD